MAEDPELIDVRADEQLDTTRLEPYLRQHLPGADGPLALRQFGGGHANLTYMLRFGDSEFVLRRPPLGPVAASSHDMKREHRVLKNLFAVYPLAPRSFLYCDDTSLIGVDFHVLERRHGIVIRRDIPERYHGRLELNRRIGEMLIDSLADLHRVDPAAAGLETLGHPEGFVERQLTGWSKRWEGAKDKDLRRVDRIRDWLHQDIPDSAQVALLHNDYKLDNMMVDPADPATPVAVLDWDMCTRGDPLMDLGYMMNYWSEAGDDPGWIKAAFMPTWHPGFMRRDAAVARYGARTGLDVSRFHWYHMFGIFKLIVVIQQIFIRYLRGQTRDERFAEFGERVEALADKAIALGAG